MLSFTHRQLDRQRTDAVVAHLQVCATCHQQQTQMATAAWLAKMQEISEHNQQWTCCDPFWGPPYPYALVTSPPSAEDIRKWEVEHGLRLPATLARALRTQNGGYVSGTEIVICPLGEFQLLSESKWDPVFRFNQIVSQRDKLLYVGFESDDPADVILSYAQGSEPAVLYLWHDLGDELRKVANPFDALLGSRHQRDAGDSSV
jgi:hypothetical protein